MNRRDLLKTLGAAGGAALAGRPAAAQEAVPYAGDTVGVLVDTTKCMGCRMCEVACAQANGLPEPETDVDLSTLRSTSPTQWSVVNRMETERGPVNVKRQCMHCLQPACASACLTNAMHRTGEGAVIWRAGKCMGCRFCMVSCPFDVPKFEYDSANPKIQKCVLCWDRLEDGKQPACVENCPFGCLEFGRRSELLDIARARIYSEPDKYVHHIYGEHEAGGAAFLYLSSVPFEQLGLRTDIGTTAYPVYTKEFLYAVPLVLTLVPPLLLAVSKARRGDAEEPEEGGGES
jgi:Fe-S-cluster-containing dehydrogenase component